ncbi:glycosyltransferase family A protein [Reyranella soli]|uniref:Glycosyltransferase 2-like domain-containing protein n=1 Tax=Reyranella soli TaxID=1230389 RepID=A0A512NR60_9HYPH|nr:glycosyltransferase family A protein [Reyranella soli]GEP61433.1 hypothetical protein RSO01_85990 [Reyranella soli]
MKGLQNLTAPSGDIAPLTVAIATHDRPHLIGDALSSCCSQTLKPERVIVIHDGLSDETSEVVGKFGALNVTYLNAGKVGLGYARNLATALCKTKYLCILDDDDLMLPNRVRDHMKSFASGAQLSHGGWVNFNDRGELEFMPGKAVTEDVMVYAGAAITHGACCYETAILREFPYRDDLAGGIDFDMAMRVVRSGVKCAHTSSYVLLRRRHAASLSAVHGGDQRSIRRAIVNMIDWQRNDADIDERRAAAVKQEEFVTIAPPLNEIYSTLGGLHSAMRVVGTVPRRATAFFSLLVGLEIDWSELEIIDADPNLTATIKLACRPTRDVAVLESFDVALRKSAINGQVLSASVLQSVAGPLATSSPPESFRLLLRSVALKELFLAHRILSQKRPWDWFVASRHERFQGREGVAHYLVSAPFRKAKSATQQRIFGEDLKAFVQEQTDLSATVIE